MTSMKINIASVSHVDLGRLFQNQTLHSVGLPIVSPPILPFPFDMSNLTNQPTTIPAVYSSNCNVGFLNWIGGKVHFLNVN